MDGTAQMRQQQAAHQPLTCGDEGLAALGGHHAVHNLHRPLVGHTQVVGQAADEPAGRQRGYM